MAQLRPTLLAGHDRLVVPGQATSRLCLRCPEVSGQSIH